MAFTKYTGTLTGSVGTLITALDAALVTGQGWDNSKTGTNKKAYQQAAGNQFYFRIDDNGTGTGGAKEALIRGGEDMSDVDTFTLNPFPDATQSSLTADSMVIRKSFDAGSARDYIIFADDRTCILFIKPESAGTVWSAYYFGDFYSLVAGDGFRTILIARNGENATDPSNQGLNNFSTNFGTATSVVGHYMARNYLGSGTSATCARVADPKFQGSVVWASTVIPAPNPPNGGIYISRQHISELTGGTNFYRGRLRGLWSWCHSTFPYAHGDTFSGTGDLAGRTFEFINPMFNTGVYTAVVETSDTLETN